MQLKGDGMKKIISCLLIFLMCFVFVGCGDNNLTEDATIPDYNFNETAQFENFNITASQIVKMEIFEDDIIKPKDGHVFLALKFSVVNFSEEQVGITSLGMFETYADGEKVKISIKGLTEFISRFTEEIAIDGFVNPAETRTGWYVVEVPEDWQELSVFVRPYSTFGEYVKFTYIK